jgi:hypothetical protein
MCQLLPHSQHVALPCETSLLGSDLALPFETSVLGYTAGCLKLFDIALFPSLTRVHIEKSAKGSIECVAFFLVFPCPCVKHEERNT